MDVVLTALGEAESHGIGQALGRDWIAGQEAPGVLVEQGAELLEVVLLLGAGQLGVVARIEADGQNLEVLARDLVSSLQHFGNAIEQRRAQARATEEVEGQNGRLVEQ